jgi:hypothetical protein
MRDSKIILHPTQRKAALVAAGKTEGQASAIVDYETRQAGLAQADYDKAPPSIAYRKQID